MAAETEIFSSPLSPEFEQTLNGQVVVFCDVDGVATKTMDSWVEIMRGQFTELSEFAVDNITQYDLRESVKHFLSGKAVPAERITEITRVVYASFANAQFFEDLAPFEQMSEALKAAQAPIIYATDRGNVTDGDPQQLTIDWLQNNGFPIEQAEVIIRSPEQKVATVKHLLETVQVDGIVFIDDCLGTIRLLRERLTEKQFGQVQVIVPQHPWTQGEEDIETTPMETEALRTKLEECVRELSEREP